jgi:hypothetical protein
MRRHRASSQARERQRQHTPAAATSALRLAQPSSPAHSTRSTLTKMKNEKKTRSGFIETLAVPRRNQVVEDKKQQLGRQVKLHPRLQNTCWVAKRPNNIKKKHNNADLFIYLSRKTNKEKTEKSAA